jgi:hypothetical protein
MTGLAHAARSRAATVAAAARSVRESPAPFSIESSGASIARRFSQSATTRALSFASPPAPLGSADSARKMCRAITLLEYLLVSRTRFASGSDSWR